MMTMHPVSFCLSGYTTPATKMVRSSPNFFTLVFIQILLESKVKVVRYGHSGWRFSLKLLILTENLPDHHQTCITLAVLINGMNCTVVDGLVIVFSEAEVLIDVHMVNHLQRKYKTRNIHEILH